jgi:hypothetical protein
MRFSGDWIGAEEAAAEAGAATDRGRWGGRTVDHAAVMNSCDAKVQRVGLAALTDVERVVALVSWANFEVELGGLSSFFYNSAGDHVAETVPALEAVGARKAAAALRAAMGKVPGGSSPEDRELRYLAWQQVSGSLGPLDTAFTRDKPDVFSRLCAFIDAHQAELREHVAGA